MDSHYEQTWWLKFRMDTDWGRQLTHLQGVHKVLDQEEAAHLLQGSVDVGQTGVHMLAESLWGDADILLDQWPAEREEEEEEEEECTTWGLAFRLKGLKKTNKQTNKQTCVWLKLNWTVVPLTLVNYRT